MTARHNSYLSILLLSHIPTILSSPQCYFPDGTIPTTLSGQPDYQPCNSTTSTSNKASACCQLSTSTCTTTGYCTLNNGYTYRGACTDPGFPQPCAQGCLNVSESSYSPIFPCDNPGNYASTWCCGIVALENGTPITQGSCCSQNFTNFSFGNPFIPPTLIETSTSITTATTTTASSTASAFALSSSSSSKPNPTSIHESASTSTHTTACTTIPPATESYPSTQSPSPSLSHPTAIGASIGAVSGFALLLCFAFLFYREYKRRIELENVIIDASYGRVRQELG